MRAETLAQVRVAVSRPAVALPVLQVAIVCRGLGLGALVARLARALLAAPLAQSLAQIDPPDELASRYLSLSLSRPPTTKREESELQTVQRHQRDCHGAVGPHFRWRACSTPKLARLLKLAPARPVRQTAAPERGAPIKLVSWDGGVSLRAALPPGGGATRAGV